MTTIKEFIDFLKEFPPNTTIEINGEKVLFPKIEKDNSNGSIWFNPEVKTNIEICDFTNNKFSKGYSWDGKIILNFGNS